MDLITVLQIQDREGRTQLFYNTLGASDGLLGLVFFFAHLVARFLAFQGALQNLFSPMTVFDHFFMSL